MTEKRIAVLGAGSWGTAIAAALAANGHRVALWGRNASAMEEIRTARENRKYLPGVALPDNIFAVHDLAEALEDADLTVFVVPTQVFRSVFGQASPMIPQGSIVVNCAKGIEIATLKRISEIVEESRKDLRFVALSGPSHAEEVGRLLPTTLVSSSVDAEAAGFVQDLFMSASLRVYTNDDVTGVEIGGALKNIIALAAGISDGMGYGDNAKAALMTRGLTEMARLGENLGGRRPTFMGLTGIGDLIVTCTSMHSRNRRCGILIGEGLTPEEAIEKVGMVVEGIYTTEAVHRLAEERGVEMPITEQLFQVIRGNVKGPDAVDNLMLREKRNEEDLHR
ncbi:MAG: NAD(P)H-dependent glycerol-3-phosphate dehydrogenase [Firmicutes bacterium]|nr:NAD(P)H-dependent glycerol-3-phosphate dehydrogenase [Bacillota bacterium]